MFPGMRSTKIAQPIDGAPNFRALPGFPIYGTGMPTLEGITAVLKVGLSQAAAQCTWWCSLECVDMARAMAAVGLASV